MFNRNPFVFPRPYSLDATSGDRPRDVLEQEGLTLRDQVALEAFAALLGRSHVNGCSMTYQDYAEHAFRAADAFLAERARPHDEQQAQWDAARKFRRDARYIVAASSELFLAVESRFVFDQPRHLLLAVQVRTETDWIDASDADAALVEAGIRRCQSDMQQAPEDYGVAFTDSAPAWAKARLF